MDFGRTAQAEEPYPTEQVAEDQEGVPSGSGAAVSNPQQVEAEHGEEVDHHEKDPAQGEGRRG